MNPPPPPPPPPRSVGRGTMTPPHESIATIPKLSSAPSSGNNIRGVDVELTSSLPPPPPPPPRLTKPSIPVTSPPSSGNFGGTIAPLPPPPNMRSTGQSSSSSSSKSEAEAEDDNAADPNGPPPPLPLMTFASKNVQTVARRQTHIPILLLATEAANRFAWKNKLQLHDMLQGLAQDSSPQPLPPFRSVTKSLTLNHIPVQFLQGEAHVSPYSARDAHDLLQQHALLQEADGNVAQELILLEDKVDQLLQEREQTTLQEVTKDAFQLTSPLNIPWLIRYRHALDASTNCLPHDLIQCPPLLLIICTTQEVSSPLECLQDLASGLHYLPRAFQNGLYDPNMLRKEVLVLHDNVDGPSDWDENVLRQSLVDTFGPNAGLVRMNSVTVETAAALAEQEDNDLWGGKGQKGNCLSVNDRVSLRRFLHTIMTSSLLPSLERRISELNNVVSERKKGVRNVLKSFWRKPKEEATSAASKASQSSEVKYRFDTIESQTRLLADTLFLMKDYENALSMYRLIKDDYKSDKAYSHYASVQEMMALCMYLTDPYGKAKEVVSHVEAALLSYTRAAEEERAKDAQQARPSEAPPATRLATRLCLILTSMHSHITSNREVEIADLLASASSHETSLGAAVLLEQSSAYYYNAGMFRKYAFHMLMSGHMFRSAGQEHHAFRCFTSALYVYRHGPWEELHNHLRSALAAQLYSMSRMAISLQLYSTLVGSTNGGKVSVKSQQKFLLHLLEICTDHPKQALAGADRMAAAPSVTSITERERIRNEQLARIVQVVRYTKRANRVLELPHINLPHVVDSSVRIWTRADDHVLTSPDETTNIDAIDNEIRTQSAFGKLSNGTQSIWDDLTLMANAELKSSTRSKPLLDDNVSAIVQKIEDPHIRSVIAQIDKEKSAKVLFERAKRSGNYKETPAVRARMEPVFVDFMLRNPLGLDVEVSGLQLVAKLSDGERLCTNEGAVNIFPSNSKALKREWTFQCSKLVFATADFCRISEGAVGEETRKASWISAADEPEPFFVVTKRGYELAPGEQKVISVGICPLVKGNLEILGVRCKLMDQVWVYHPFDIKGPLLSNIRSSGSKRERGECMLLKSSIDVDMPCLKVDLVKPDGQNGTLEDGGILQGQITQWNLRVSNIGSAPAANFTLKTNLQWVNIVKSTDNVDGEDFESRACSGAVGSTGTLVKIPLYGSGLSDPGVIHPGETVDIPIEIRAPSAGLQDFYMLYRYEMWDIMFNTGRHRWLRKMYVVPVHPSLTMSASVAKSGGDDNEHLLSVEITNDRADEQEDLSISLDKFGLISRRYRLEALPGQFDQSNGNINSLKLEWQERVTVHFRIIPLEDDNETCRFSECSFMDQSCNADAKYFAKGGINYLCLERAKETFEAAWKSHQLELARAEHAEDGDSKHPRSIAQIRRANTSDTAASDTTNDVYSKGSLHPTSIGILCPPELSTSEINIMCSWRASDREGNLTTLRGQHHFRGIAVRPISTSIGCPLVPIASYNRIVTNDFDQGPAVVPIEVKLQNQLVEASVDFDIAVDPTETFELVGLEYLASLSLQGNDEMTFPLKAIIPRAGVYNLQALRLAIKNDGEVATYRFPFQWLVTVMDSD